MDKYHVYTGKILAKLSIFLRSFDLIFGLNGNSILFWILRKDDPEKIAVERKKLVFLFLQLNTRCADGWEVREFALKKPPWSIKWHFLRLQSEIPLGLSNRFPFLLQTIKPLKIPNFPASPTAFPYLNFAILFEKSELEFFVAALTAKQKFLQQKDMMEERK